MRGPRASAVGWHAALLLVVLLGLWPFVTNGSVFHADEGAVLAQLDLIERTGDWTAPNPQPELDPEMEALPLELSGRNDRDRYAPYNKHPVYVLAVRGASALTGAAGPVLVSILGTWIAAITACVLAERVRRGAGLPALWIAGVGSPLLFDAYVVQAHALGAALVGAAAVAATSIVGVRGRRRLLCTSACCALVASAVLVRTEALFVGPALGAGIALTVGIRPAGLAVAAVVATAGAATWRTEVRLLLEPLTGRQLSSIRSGREEIEQGAAQLEAVRLTVFKAGDEAGLPVAAGAAAAGLAWICAIGIRLRRRPIVVGAAVAAAVGYAVRALDGGLVPGLVIATPVLAGLAGLTGERLRRPPASVLAVSSVLFLGAVVATQYSNGGGANWGGRFFAIGLPLLLPLAVVGWLDAIDRLDRPARRVVVVGGGAVVVTLAALACVSMLRERQAIASYVDDIQAARRDAATTASPAPVLATTGIPGRFAWEESAEGVWLTVDVDHIDRYAERLAATAQPIVLVSFDPEIDVPELARWFDVVEDRGSGIVILRPNR